MLFAALFNAVYIYCACLFPFVILLINFHCYLFKCFLFSCFVFELQIQSLLKSFIILYHVQCLQSVGFLNFMFMLFLFMKELCALWRNNT